MDCSFHGERIPKALAASCLVFWLLDLMTWRSSGALTDSGVITVSLGANASISARQVAASSAPTSGWSRRPSRAAWRRLSRDSWSLASAKFFLSKRLVARSFCSLVCSCDSQSISNFLSPSTVTKSICLMYCNVMGKAGSRSFVNSVYRDVWSTAISSSPSSRGVVSRNSRVISCQSGSSNSSSG